MYMINEYIVVRAYPIIKALAFLENLFPMLEYNDQMEIALDFLKYLEECKEKTSLGTDDKKIKSYLNDVKLLYDQIEAYKIPESEIDERERITWKKEGAIFKNEYCYSKTFANWNVDLLDRKVRNAKKTKNGYNVMPSRGDDYREIIMLLLWRVELPEYSVPKKIEDQKVLDNMRIKYIDKESKRYKTLMIKYIKTYMNDIIDKYALEEYDKNIKAYFNSYKSRKI